MQQLHERPTFFPNESFVQLSVFNCLQSTPWLPQDIVEQLHERLARHERIIFGSDDSVGREQCFAALFQSRRQLAKVTCAADRQR